MKTIQTISLIAFIAFFVFQGCDDFEVDTSKYERKKPKADDEGIFREDNPDGETFYGSAHQRISYKHLLNKESVQAALNNFFQAIESVNQQQFLDCYNLETMKAYFSMYIEYSMEQTLKYLDVKEAKKVFGFFYKTLNPKYAQMFYSREMRGDPNVGWGYYDLQPKEEFVKKYDINRQKLVIRLKINTEKVKWEIVEMNFPKQYNLNRSVCVTIEGETHWEAWKYKLPLDEYVKFMRNHKSDDDYYVPPDVYKVKKLKVLQPLENDRPEYETKFDDYADVTFPKLITDIVLTDDQEQLFGRVRSGLVGTWRDFEPLKHRKRGIVGALINLIIDSANDRFKDDAKRNAALEANNALIKIYSKDSIVDRVKYRIKIGLMSTIEQKVESFDVIYLWLELFEKSSWKK
ncbi:MAG: hypothetical protein KAR20_09470 [Candidatus Heimdallarchaeota archaeon]|nr:hypothetical protein [Candidatus Heimdallarchaeota archaeon]